MARDVLLFLLLATAICSANAQRRVEQSYARANNTIALPILASSLTSIATQLSYKYYTLGLCKPPSVKTESQSLGDMLVGTVRQSSAYTMNVEKDIPCKILCRMDYNQKDVQKMKEFIDDNYMVHMWVDGLPVVTRLPTGPSVSDYIYSDGFRLGFFDDKGNAYLNNHVDFVVRTTGKEQIQIIAVEVSPASVTHDKNWEPTPEGTSCNGKPSSSPVQVDPSQTSLMVIYTYTVTWENSTRSHDDRWDPYGVASADSVHYFSMINSLLIVIFLAGMIALITTRILQTECCAKWRMPFDRADTEEVTWKLVSGDVFRPPMRPMLLAALVGNGIQVLVTVAVITVVGWWGYFTPDNHGAILTAVPVVFAFGGLFAGHLSTIAFHHMGDLSIWRNTAIMTSVLAPGIILILLAVLDVMLSSTGADSTIPAKGYFTLVAIWIFLDVPLVFFGSYLASRQTPPEFPCRPNAIPRMIPPQPWYLRSWCGILMAGLLPYGVVFVPLFFVNASVWLQQYFSFWGFSFIAFLLLVICSAETSIIMCFFHLCNEDWEWWWRAFLAPGSAGLYSFLYSIFYFAFKLNIAGFVPTMLYFIASLLFAFGLTALCGAVGYFASLVFVMKIYQGQQ